MLVEDIYCIFIMAPDGAAHTRTCTHTGYRYGTFHRNIPLVAPGMQPELFPLETCGVLWGGSGWDHIRVRSLLVRVASISALLRPPPPTPQSRVRALTLENKEGSSGSTQLKTTHLLRPLPQRSFKMSSHQRTQLVTSASSVQCLWRIVEDVKEPFKKNKIKLFVLF